MLSTSDFQKEFARAQRLVRFRANPKKVRVAVRRDSKKNMWVVTIDVRTREDNRPDEPLFTRSSKDPEKALMRALKDAEKNNLPGIDLGMAWTYEHPFRGQES